MGDQSETTSIQSKAFKGIGNKRSTMNATLDVTKKGLNSTLGGRRRVGPRESKQRILDRSRTIANAAVVDPGLVQRIDELINHNVTFESETVNQIENLKDIIAALSL